MIEHCGAQLIKGTGNNWRGIVFTLGAGGKMVYETRWYRDREGAKSEIDGWLEFYGRQVRWLADSRPPREQ